MDSECNRTHEEKRHSWQFHAHCLENGYEHGRGGLEDHGEQRQVFGIHREEGEFRQECWGDHSLRIITEEMAEAIQAITSVPSVDKAVVEKLVLLCCACGYEQAKKDWEQYNEAVAQSMRIIH